MFDEKNPRQESVKIDSSQNEAIIDLTNEVSAKTEIENDMLELSNAKVDEPPNAAGDDKTSEDETDEEILALDESGNLESPEEESVIDLNDQAPENQVQFGDDQLIASAMKNTLRLDQDDTEELTEQFDLNAFDEEDILIVDNTQDEADENFNAVAGREAVESQRDEDVFDLEEQIELEYEFDDDEDQIIELDDERTENEHDFVDLMLGASKKPDQSDDYDDDEPTVFLELKPENPDDITVMDAELDHATEVFAPAGDEAPEFDDSDNLPDLEAVSELDFEDEENGLAIDEQKADSSDDIIARAVKQSLGSHDDLKKVDLTDETGFGEKHDDAIMDLDGSRDDDAEILALAEEEPLKKFSDEDDLLDLDEGADPEEYTQIIPLDGFNDLKAEDEEDIIEITEFDQHFPTDDAALLKQPDILDTSGADGKDFLELIDIEEDSLSDDKELIEFNDSQAKNGLEKNKTIEGMDELPAVPPGQIDAAIERVISEKFSGKIENIIYEVIEKAVAKEIDRVKGALMGSNTMDDYEE